MKSAKLLSVLLVIACFAGICNAQPFAEDIAAFKKADALKFPPKHAILFVGSSSFTKWTDVQDYFPGYTIINRGFGGSTLPDVIRYAGQVIYPYQPKEIVIYCGENDVASSDTVTAQIVFERFKQLFGMIRTNLPKTKVVFISLKPSPSRWKMQDRVTAANKLISAYINNQKNAMFIDVYHKMLGADGLPLPGIFIEDSLHMNAQGYAIWKKEIEPVLMK
ncbi:MAG TPA: GDSL-type esterase/lipase family protein [Panacibacter sp.]|nr:GDSL-type esterase/lipase family protein [Panacibacter sp.]HNP44766.1 GDSL-type esterase/lipase family protein [Panacibacter sp.]